MKIPMRPVSVKAEAGRFMLQALVQARRAGRLDEVPVGAVIVKDGRVIARGHNLTRTKHDPTAHAEIVALRRASAKLKNERLIGAELYVTLEPCAMCAGAIVQARLAAVHYGTRDPKAGACGSALKVLPHLKLNHRPAVSGGVLAAESAQILVDFFRRKRAE